MARARTSPRPGVPVRGSTTGRPIMALFDLLGRRWALRVLWELRDGPKNFRDLRAACGDISPTVLADRVADLREAGIVELVDRGYQTTEHGASLIAALAPLNAWAAAWGRRSKPAP
jgi:DNA-binding HxlR family transcriptional regulator